MFKFLQKTSEVRTSTCLKFSKCRVPKKIDTHAKD
eukprot:UN25966